MKARAALAVQDGSSAAIIMKNENKTEKVFARESEFKPEQEKKKRSGKSFHVHSGKCQSMTSPGPAVRADADAQFGSCHCTGAMYGVLQSTTTS